MISRYYQTYETLKKLQITSCSIEDEIHRSKLVEVCWTFSKMIGREGGYMIFIIVHFLVMETVETRCLSRGNLFKTMEGDRISRRKSG